MQVIVFFYNLQISRKYYTCLFLLIICISSLLFHTVDWSSTLSPCKISTWKLVVLLNWTLYFPFFLLFYVDIFNRICCLYELLIESLECSPEIKIMFIQGKYFIKISFSLTKFLTKWWDGFCYEADCLFCNYVHCALRINRIHASLAFIVTRIRFYADMGIVFLISSYSYSCKYYWYVVDFLVSSLNILKKLQHTER